MNNMEVLSEKAKGTTVERADFIRSTLQTAKHVVVRWKVSGLKTEDPVVRFSSNEVGMNRVTFVQAVVPGEHTSVAWGGEAKDVTLRFDGWPGQDFEVVCSIWGN